jgi:hypothetical protein
MKTGNRQEARGNRQQIIILDHYPHSSLSLERRGLTVRVEGIKI